MKPLSVFVFLKGSIKKILPVTITVCLGVAILYFMAMFTMQLDLQVNEVALYPFKNMSVIYGEKTGVSAEDIYQLKKNINNEKLLMSDFWYINYYSIVGNTTTSLILLEEKDAKAIMDTLDLKLTQGQLPKNKMEVILHKKLGANRGVKLGTIISKNEKGWHINEDIKVVGFFEGESVIGIGINGEEIINPNMPGASVLVCGDKEGLASVNNYIEKDLGEKYQISTLGISKNEMDKFYAPMSTMKLFIGIVLILVIGIFLSNITTIQYTLRKKELELLHALGYTRRYIVIKGLKEIGLSSLIGYIFGITLAVLIGWVINIYFLSDKGLAMPLLSKSSILIMLMVPITTTAFSMIAPMKLTRFRDIF